jgi:hypothetical protein
MAVNKKVDSSYIIDIFVGDTVYHEQNPQFGPRMLPSRFNANYIIFQSLRGDINYKFQDFVRNPD